MPWLPSWHAYSNTPALSGRDFMSSAAVHGAVHVAGSVKVTWYWIASRLVRVNRSVSRSPATPRGWPP